MLTSLPVDEIYAEVYEIVYLFQRLATKSENGCFLFKRHELSFICVQIETNVFCCLLQTLRLGLDGWICEKHQILCIIVSAGCRLLFSFLV